MMEQNSSGQSNKNKRELSPEAKEKVRTGFAKLILKWGGGSTEQKLQAHDNIFKSMIKRALAGWNRINRE